MGVDVYYKPGKDTLLGTIFDYAPDWTLEIFYGCMIESFNLNPSDASVVSLLKLNWLAGFLCYIGSLDCDVYQSWRFREK